MLIPAFQLHLKDSIQSGLAAVGRYDGRHPCLTAATSGGKVFVHNPHHAQQAAAGAEAVGGTEVGGGVGGTSEVSYLNAAAAVTALAAGCLDDEGRQGANGGRDVLLVGTASTLLAYDVHRNADAWHKDLQDGVSRLAVGRVQRPGGGSSAPLAVVGGNCSVVGLDAKGDEAFWTVTGDNVGAMAFADADGDGNRELLVGSDDFEIRVFRGEEVIAEVTEAERVVGLTELSGSRYGYALANGTIGVYDRGQRAWRVKSKHKVHALGTYDLDGDGVPELVSGWSNGKVEVRMDRTGETVYKDTLSSAVASLQVADYRLDGKEELIACGVNGELKGYLPAEGEAIEGNLMGNDAEEEKMALLAQEKQELLFELQSIERRLTKSSASGPPPVVPLSTKLEQRLEPNVTAGAVDMVVSCTPPAVITGIISFGERLFEDESIYAVPERPTHEMRVPLRPKVDQAITTLNKCIVSMPGAAGYHIFNFDLTLPPYCMYKRAAKGSAVNPDAGVSFHISPNMVPRLAVWVSQTFAGAGGADSAAGQPAMADPSANVDELFVSLRDGSPLAIRASAAAGQVTVRCADMDMAGSIVQDLCAALNIGELESIANFPAKVQAFGEVLARVEQYNSTRVRMTAEMAEITNTVKSLVVKAEDARMMGNMPHMRKMYSAMRDANRDLVLEHTKRATNHAELLAALKEVNQMIQRAARLRAGSAKARVVSACRAAIKNNSPQAINKIIADGAYCSGPLEREFLRFRNLFRRSEVAAEAVDAAFRSADETCKETGPTPECAVAWEEYEELRGAQRQQQRQDGVVSVPAGQVQGAAEAPSVADEIAAAAALRRETPELPLTKVAQGKFGDAAMDPCADAEACEAPTGTFETAAAMERAMRESAEEDADVPDYDSGSDSNIIERKANEAHEVCGEGTQEQCATAWDEVEEVASGLHRRKQMRRDMRRQQAKQRKEN